MMQSPHMQQLRQRVTASYHLGPMDRAATQAYICHRLTHVGWKGDPKFEDDAFGLIHAVTGGVPRRINTLCNRLLLSAYLGEKHVLQTSDVQAIAREIREELGPETMLAAVPAAMLREPVSGGAYPSTGSGFASPGESASVLPQLRALEERMARLERSLDGTLDLLHRLAQQEQQQPGKPGKPGAPRGR